MKFIFIYLLIKQVWIIGDNVNIVILFQVTPPGGLQNAYWMHGATHSREWLGTATLLKIMDRVRIDLFKAIHSIN